jgi:DNA-directed RNA polymerase subunit N (RpoN/RPB10)
MRKDLFIEANLQDVIAHNLPITTEIDQPSLVPIFQQLNIELYCCRKSLMGVAEFTQLLK